MVVGGGERVSCFDFGGAGTTRVDGSSHQSFLQPGALRGGRLSDLDLQTG